MQLVVEDNGFSFGARHETLPQSVVEAYSEPTAGKGPCARSIEDLVRDRAGVLRAIFAQALPKATGALVEGAKDSYFLDYRANNEPGKPLTLFFVVPVGQVAISIELHGPADASFGDDYLTKWISPLPLALRPMAQTFRSISVHLVEPAYAGIADIRLAQFPAGTTSIEEFVKGKARQTLSAQFEDLGSVRVFGMEDAEAWFTCVNVSSIESALWLVTEKGRFVKRLMDPGAAYDALLVHHLTGSTDAFDLTPWTA